MGKPTNETGLTKNIVKAIVAAHPAAWIFKVHGGPMQMTGVPDLIVCVDGLMFGMEIKHQKPGESIEHAKLRTTPGQRFQIREINKAGGMARTVTSPEEALKLIAQGLKNTER